MKRTVLTIIGILAILCASGQKKRIILDADTANEVDDLFAIVRAAIEPNLEITALNGTQWQTAHWATEQSMEDSYRLNSVLLGHLGLSGSIPTFRGGVDRMYDWGDLAQHSAASYEIIRQAKTIPEGERLTIVALGALTNVASALVIDPSIESRIEVYWLGTQMNFETGTMSHVDFNAMMDIRALHEMLNSTVPMTIIPVNVASAAQFTMKETVAGLPMDRDVCNFILFNWFNHKDGGRKSRTLWDLALIETVINPEMATITPIKTSIDSGNRVINYYSDIDIEAMKKDFFEVLKERL